MELTHLFACYLHGGTLYEGSYKKRWTSAPVFLKDLRKEKKVSTRPAFLLFVSSQTSCLALNPKDYSFDFHLIQLTGLCSSFSGGQSHIIES